VLIAEPSDTEAAYPDNVPHTHVLEILMMAFGFGFSFGGKAGFFAKCCSVTRYIGCLINVDGQQNYANIRAAQMDVNITIVTRSARMLHWERLSRL